ncbi:hypothetical protein GCM10011359_10180 [Nesterenkonia alkaliphila]|nr:hypothetical protein GCM10011359_10180 [Nesterenkonia alkaliphila]
MHILIDTRCTIAEEPRPLWVRPEAIGRGVSRETAQINPTRRPVLTTRHWPGPLESQIAALGITSTEKTHRGRLCRISQVSRPKAEQERFGPGLRGLLRERTDPPTARVVFCEEG